MKVLTTEELSLERYPYVIRSGKDFFLRSNEDFGLEVSLVEECSSLPELSFVLVLAGLSKAEDYVCTLFSIADWDIFVGPTRDQIGWRMINRIRQSHHELRPMESAPHHFFGQDEMYDAAGFVLAAMLFSWDAYLCTAGANCLIQVSHDEKIFISCCNQHIFDRISENLKDFGIRRSASAAKRLNADKVK